MDGRYRSQVAARAIISRVARAGPGSSPRDERTIIVPYLGFRDLLE